ncbi:MAG TPA: AraC family ligand binding domain-containing protein, partial [Burkholderiaceae bacterium]|nr:AraC family ligand binding domain-containing protein [Burkholderiaceae bacterium]
MTAAPPTPSLSTPNRSLPRGTAPPIAPLTPHLFRPDAHRPLRGKRHHLNADTQVIPHHHDWGQVVLSTTGVVRLTVDRGTYIVPPSRALWVPPGVEHAVTVVEDTELLTLYLHQPRGRHGPGVAREHAAEWRQCRVLEVSPLLRALALELDMRPDGRDPVPLDR